MSGDWAEVELPDIVKDWQVGDMREGEFMGRETIPADKPFEVLVFRHENGELWQTSSSGGLGPKFKNIRVGTYVRIEMTGEQDTGKPSLMKVFKVLVRS